MKTRPLHWTGCAALLSLAGAAVASAHDIGGSDVNPRYDFSVTPPGVLLAQANAPRNRVQVGGRSVRTNRPVQASAFEAFAPEVGVRWDERFLFIESNGLPSHNMMVGITAWQQQVPLPQSYTGDNAWRIPLAPVPAKEVVSIKNRFLRGAIAIAANGIPIFNPQNNRGEVSAEIGELDEWGGHCGRADDYHYHAAPLHLQSVLGEKLPIAYALDGYPIYGLTEPDGTQPGGLDAFNGHTTNALGYHYHASKKYPYVNGGFHGEVVEREQQVDPQPHAQPVRPALQALRGAKITGFTTSPDDRQRSLAYTVNGRPAAVNFSGNPDGSWKFTFVSTDGSKQEETYTRRSDGAGRGRGGEPGGPPRRDSAGGPPRDDRGGPGGPPPPRDERNAQPGRADRGGPQDRRGDPREGEPANSGPSIAMDALKKPGANFVLTSPEVGADGRLPVEFTGDGRGSTLPLAWRGAPARTQSFALVMDHLTPDNAVKSYWVMWDIPASTASLPKNVSGVGKVGTSFRGTNGYEPPHSKGPGKKTYVLTIYALASPVQLTQQAREVTREVLLTAMQGKVLASASLDVNYDRSGVAGAQGDTPPRPGEGRPPRGGQGGPDAQRPPRRDGVADQGGGNSPNIPSRADQPPPQPPQQVQPDDRKPAGSGGSGGRSPGGKAGGKGGGDNKGLIKPTMADTVKVNVYADNWFAMFINGELVATDSIKFTPHNVISFDILPEYPMTIAVIAKDNADPKTGLEYGDHIGDGGLCIKFADGTVTNATWKARSFFKGPTNRDVKNPAVEHTPIPDEWWKPGFDDSDWANATEFAEDRVNPKEPFFKADFSGAKWIWSSDLDLDNTVIFRTRIEKPGWVKRWNTKPDIDISGAPYK